MGQALSNIAKLAGIISATEPRFGADPTGVVDSTAALEAAAVEAAGKTLWLPPGSVFLVASEFDIAGAGTFVAGHGARIVKAATFSGSTCIRVRAADVTIVGLEIDGTDYVADGIRLSSDVAPGITVKDCVIYGCLYGISATSNTRVTIEGCTVSDCAASPVRIHNVVGTSVHSDIKVLNNTFDTTDADPATLTHPCLLIRGTETYPTKNVKVSGNTFLCVDNPTSTAAMGCEIRWCVGGSFVGNDVENGAMIVSIAGSKRIAVTGNSGVGQNGWAIEIAGVPSSTTACDGVSVTGNTIDGQGRCVHGIAAQGTVASGRIAIGTNAITGCTRAIYVNAQWKDIAITGNAIESTNATSDQHGIWLVGSQVNATITGNMLKGDGSTEYAIQVTDSTHVTISNNNMDGWVYGIRLNNTTTIDDIAMLGNTFKSVTNTITSVGAGTFGERIQAIGNVGLVRTGCESFDYLNFTRNVIAATGTGAPGGTLSAGVGSTFRRRDGGASTTFYVSEAGGTVWVGK